MIWAALALGLLAPTPTCSPLALFDAFGEVPFDTADVRPLIGTVLVGNCEDVGDCRVHDRLGVDYDILDGAIVAKSTTPEAASGLPFGLGRYDDFGQIHVRLMTVSLESEPQITVYSGDRSPSPITVGLCGEAVELRIEREPLPSQEPGMRISRIGIYAQT